MAGRQLERLVGAGGGTSRHITRRVFVLTHCNRGRPPEAGGTEVGVTQGIHGCLEQATASRRAAATFRSAVGVCHNSGNICERPVDE